MLASVTLCASLQRAVCTSFSKCDKSGKLFKLPQSDETQRQMVAGAVFTPVLSPEANRNKEQKEGFYKGPKSPILCFHFFRALSLGEQPVRLTMDPSHSVLLINIRRTPSSFIFLESMELARCIIEMCPMPDMCMQHMSYSQERVYQCPSALPFCRNLKPYHAPK